MRIRATNSMQLSNRRLRCAHRRSEDGISMMELLFSCIVGSILLFGIYSSVMSMYRATALTETQILATNMAQQVIDNARNSTFANLWALSPGTETLSLYDYPASPAMSMFPRPLLRNESFVDSMTYSDASLVKRFNGTVNETLTQIGTDVGNRMLRVDVSVAWTDSTGPHSYSTGTVISENGIHN